MSDKLLAVLEFIDLGFLLGSYVVVWHCLWADMPNHVWKESNNREQFVWSVIPTFPVPVLP